MGVNQFEQGISQRTKDKLHYGTAGFLILSAVVLAFISFFITLTVGTGVIAWGGLCMGTALTLIGGGMYFHSQMVTFETKANMKMEEMAEQLEHEMRRRYRPRPIEKVNEVDVENDGTESKENS